MNELTQTIDDAQRLTQSIKRLLSNATMHKGTRVAALALLDNLQDKLALVFKFHAQGY